MLIKFDQYRIFCITANSKSFSEAANKLYMTQSAVSQQIKNMEKVLGTSLFVRSKNGTKLTPQGEELLKYAENAISLLESIEGQFNSSKSLEEGYLRIGAGDTVSHHYLLPALDIFHAQYPNIKIEITNRVTSGVLSKLAAGKVELGFVNLPISQELYDSRLIDVTPTLTVSDIFVAGNLFSHLKGRNLSMKEISDLPLIMLEPKSNSRLSVDSFFEQNGITLKPEIELGSHDLLLEFAKKNLGVSCVTKEFSTAQLNSHDLFEIKTDFSIPDRYIGICRMKGVTLTPPAEKFIEILSSINN